MAIADQRQQRTGTLVSRSMACDLQPRTGLAGIDAFERQQHRLARKTIDQPHRLRALGPKSAFGFG